jgi:hypothetical protein
VAFQAKEIDYIVDTKMPMGTGWLLGAQSLAEDFPANPDLQRFLAAHAEPPVP